MTESDPEILYLHGLPGSAQADLAIAFGRNAPPPDIAGLERLPAVDADKGYAQSILDAFDNRFEGLGAGKVRLAGFSLGAMATLHIAAARAEKVSSVDLIAPGAPLQLGEFIKDMAGKPVFQAARAGKLQLGMLAGIQSVGLRLAPGLIARQLLASAPEAEQGLMAEPARREAYIAGMKHAIHVHGRAYRTELEAYVSDWTPILAHLDVPVRIWQGTLDNWAPPEMAEALSSSIGRTASIQWLDGLSHYGALCHALPEIVEAS